MTDSKIQWTKRSDWNPVRGCTRASEGCRFCYAEQIAGRFSDPGQAFHGFATRTPAGGRWTGKVELVEERLALPLSWKKPALIFANSTSDFFHEALPFDVIDQLFAVMALASQHTFQVLTKRADRMRAYFGPSDELDGITRDVIVDGAAQARYAARTGEDPSMWLAVHWPLPNVWLGVSCEDQETADQRIPDLLQTPAAKRFISAEPLLGPINLRRIQDAGDERGYYNALSSSVGPNLDLVIVGGESGRGARCHVLDWDRSIIQQCKTTGVAVFEKQLGRFPYDGDPPRLLKLHDTKGGDISEWPEDLRVREMPR